MPTYEYRAKDKAKSCSACVDGFDVVRRMSDDPLTQCPECGAPVERVYSTFALPNRPSTKAITSDDNLKRHGFSKLINEGNGKYRKAF